MEVVSAIPALEVFHTCVRGALSYVRERDARNADIELLRLHEQKIIESLRKLRDQTLVSLEQEKARKVQDLIDRGLYNSSLKDCEFRRLEEDAWTRINDAEKEATRTFEEIAIARKKLMRGFRYLEGLLQYLKNLKVWLRRVP
jgi:hypothetical protein